ncbi:MAG TPA: NAD(P)-dependent oxidoreductase [Nocardioidaceae bacterium]|nr:NAD(P)-dependent oxidoreductase [Nocardioidaceae bacterium]
MTTSNPTVALLGTGIMGAAMARNIAQAGIPVRVWNRSRARSEPLAEAGATVADSAADAVRGAEVVITMVFDEAGVADTIQAARDGLSRETIWVQQSTVGPDGADRLATLADELGVVYVDAPVLGTRKPAEDGTLVVLASGPADVHARLAGVFDAIGSRTMWLGAAGEASRLKMAANAWTLVAIEGIAESLALTRELGLDPQLFLDAVAGGAVDSPYVQGKGKAMLAGEFSPAFSLDGAAKDGGLIVDAAQAAGLELRVIEAARDHVVRAAAAGHGEKDMSATFLEH